MQLKEAYQKAVLLLTEAGIENAQTDARLLLCHILGADTAYLLLHRQDPFDFSRLSPFLEKRVRHVPLQYITGETEWMSLPFLVNENVLIPRQDTECLAEFVLEQMRSKKTPKILDLCTGSGCLAICFSHYLPHSKVFACDKSPGALAVAQKNQNALGTSVCFFEKDLLKEEPEGMYDCIVSNPPYIETGTLGALPEEVRAYEPTMALDGGQDGLVFYRRLVPVAAAHASPGGLVAMEIGMDQKSAVLSLFSRFFTNCGCLKDYSGLDRVVFGWKEDPFRKKVTAKL